MVIRYIANSKDRNALIEQSFTLKEQCWGFLKIVQQPNPHNIALESIVVVNVKLAFQDY